MNQSRWVWIVFGWGAAVAVTALAIFGLSVLNLLADTAAESSGWLIAAIAVGFAAGGFIAGMRTGDAPFVTGLGIGLFSVVVWLLANLLSSTLAGLAEWAALPLDTTLALLFVQAAAAMVGARLAARWLLARRPDRNLAR